MSVTVRLEPSALDPSAELARFLQSRPGDGAVVSFVGLARDVSSIGEAVERLRLDHYPGMTEASLETVAREGAGRFEVSGVAVVHRCGDIGPQEAIVFVAAASRHRAQAFACADYLMDRLKTEAVFWKREEGAGRSRWIEPTPADLDRRARWRD